MEYNEPHKTYLLIALVERKEPCVSLVDANDLKCFVKSLGTTKIIDIYRFEKQGGTFVPVKISNKVLEAIVNPTIAHPSPNRS